MGKELRFVLDEFCRLYKIPFNKGITVTFQERNKVTGNSIFFISGGGITPVRYEHERIDLSKYTDYKGLTLDDGGFINPNTVNKVGIASLFNRHTRMNLLPSDIGQLVVRGGRVTVVGSSNSMRFKHSFSMRYK